MNLAHRYLCRSEKWAKTLDAYVLPWTLEGVDLGSELLEIGPGPGLTTDRLHTRVRHLTCVEVDSRLASSLATRMSGQNVTVLHADATKTSLPDASFDAAVCLTMLHHVPSVALQDRLLAEVARLLRPGGTFAGTDSLTSFSFRLLHLFDTLVPVNPATFPDRLRAAGFDDVHVDVNPYAFRFRARKPAH